MERAAKHERRGPTWRDIKDAISPGDKVFVLDENGQYQPRVVHGFDRKCLHTDVGDILFKDHGWLWWCLPH